MLLKNLSPKDLNMRKPNHCLASKVKKGRDKLSTPHYHQLDENYIYRMIETILKFRK